MKKPINEIEKLLDEENQDNLVLYDENNKKTEFEQVAIIPLNEEIYAILKPVDNIDGVNEDEALVFSVQEIDEEDCLVVCEDEKIINKVFKEYYKLLESEGFEVDKELLDEVK